MQNHQNATIMNKGYHSKLQDENLREALRQEEAALPQMPADLNGRLMKRLHHEKRQRHYRVWPWVAAACVATVMVVWLLPPKEKGSEAMTGSGELTAQTCSIVAGQGANNDLQETKEIASPTTSQDYWIANPDTRDRRIANSTERMERITNSTERTERITNPYTRDRRIANSTERMERIANSTERTERIANPDTRDRRIANSTERGMERITNLTEQKRTERITNPDTRDRRIANSTERGMERATEQVLLAQEETAEQPEEVSASDEIAPAHLPRSQAKPQQVVLTERDIPISRPENYRYTPEELALMRRQANEAYVKWMELEMEIAKHQLEQIAKQ